MVKGFPAGLHVPSRAIMLYYTWATIGYLDLLWALSNGEFAWGKVLASASLSPPHTHFSASLKMFGMTITYSGYCHPPLLDKSTTTPAQNLHCVPIHSKKGQKLFKISLRKIFVSGRTWSNLLKKRDEKKYPWSLPKEFKRGVQIKWPKNISKSVSPFLPLPWTFVIP